MSLTSDMARIETLAKRGMGVEEIIAAGVRVAPQTVAAIVQRSPPPPPRRGLSVGEVSARILTRYSSRAVRAYIVVPIRGLSQPVRPALKQIIRETAALYELTEDDIIGPGRQRYAVHARHHAMYAAACSTIKSLPAIGVAFGNRDHTTILHGIRSHAARNHLPLPRGMTPEPIRRQA